MNDKIGIKIMHKKCGTNTFEQIMDKKKLRKVTTKYLTEIEGPKFRD